MYFIIFVILMRWNVPFDKVEGSFQGDKIFLISSHHFIFVLIVASFLPFHLFCAFFLSFILFFYRIFTPTFSFIFYILLYFLHSPIFSTTLSHDLLKYHCLIHYLVQSYRFGLQSYLMKLI